MSTSNSICSESELGYVDTLEECKTAIPFLQQLYPDIPSQVINYTRENYPKGCYAYTKTACSHPKGCMIRLDNETKINRRNSYHGIYFNNHELGGPYPNNRQVCKVETNGNPLVRFI